MVQFLGICMVYHTLKKVTINLYVESRANRSTMVADKTMNTDNGIYFEAQITIDTTSVQDDPEVLIMIGHINEWHASLNVDGNVYYKYSAQVFSKVKTKLECFMEILGDGSHTYQRIVRIEYEQGSPI